ncbi:hypothetical protein HDU99_000933 [Rhizoclosmatium hyalinum]|nr:hypothetical protein HDU99_000933 [Rhizoclosmatium hyalinum]
MLFQEVKAVRPGASSNLSLGPVDEFGYPLSADQITARGLSQKELTEDVSKKRDEVVLGFWTVKEWFNKKTDKWIIDKVIYKRLNYLMGGLYVTTVVYVIIVQVISSSNSIVPLSTICLFDLLQYGLLAVSVIFIQIFGGLLAVWLVHDIRDSNFIAGELLISYSVGAPCSILYLIFQETPSLKALSFNPNWLVIIPHFVSHIMAIVVPVILSYIEDYKTAQVVIELNLQSFQMALEDKTLFEDIKQYAIRDMCGENMYFLEALKVLKREAISTIMRRRQHSRQPSNINCGTESQRKASAAFANIKFLQNKNDVIAEVSKEALDTVESMGRKGTRESTSTALQSGTEKRWRTASIATTTTTNEEGSSMLSPSRKVSSSQTNSALPSQTNSALAPVQEDDSISLKKSEKPRKSVSSEQQKGKTSVISFSIFHDRSQSMESVSRANGSSTTSQLGQLNATAVPQELVSKYHQFYLLYCKPGGQMEVNLSGEIRQELKQVYDSGEWKVGAFDRARSEIMNVLFTNIYCRWAFQQNDKERKKSVA